MKKQAIILFMVSCLVGALYAEKLTTLTEVLKPDSLVLDRENIYVTEGAMVFVYSREDFKLKMQFGKQGEGPGEFIPGVTVFPRENDLFITSRNKMSFFTRSGEFIRAEKPANFYDLFPLGDHYAARGSAIEDNLHFITVNILDSKLDITRELARMQSLGQRGDRISPIRGKLIHKTDGARVVLAHFRGFEIRVFDGQGNLLHEIKEDDDRVRVKFTAADEQDVRKYFEGSNPEFYAGIRDRLDFPDYFPPIRNLYLSAGKIYVMTYQKEKENTGFRIYTLDGKFVKSIFLPVRFRNFFTPEPFDFYDDDMYILIENENEEWEVHQVTVG